MGFDNIWNNDGFGIAVAGMSIVFVTLTLICLFIALLPRLLQVLEFFLPVEPEPVPAVDRGRTEDEQLIAAIGIVLHDREIRKRQGKH